MKDLKIEICVCTECVMNGAMDIMDSAEQLLEQTDHMRREDGENPQITVSTVNCLGESKHGEHSPRVAINGTIFENADSQTVMAEIVSSMKKDGE